MNNYMKILLLMNENSYAGRQYAQQLKLHKISFDIITIGSYPEFDIDENSRCGGFWNPLTLLELGIKDEIYKFKSLKSDDLICFLELKKYDLSIQGGTGIINQNIIDKFKYGILNFHPGDLPNYRGCSAPEWQVYEGKNVVSTCHFIDQGIDSGPILEKKILDVSKENYFKFRASIYPQTSFFLVDIINRIIDDIRFLNRKTEQKSKASIYRKYIGNTIIENLKIKFLNNEIG